MGRSAVKLAYLIASIKAHGKSDKCLEWPFARKKKTGYGVISYEGRPRQVSHVVWNLFRGRLDAPCVLHICDNPPCYNPRHLFKGTQTQNVVDKCQKNRQAKGETAGHVRLTEKLALKIRAEYKKGRRRIGSSSHIAAKYGISKETVLAVAQRRTWKHI